MYKKYACGANKLSCPGIIIIILIMIIMIIIIIIFFYIYIYFLLLLSVLLLYGIGAYLRPYIIIIMSVDISYLAGWPVGPPKERLSGHGLQTFAHC